LGVTSKKKAVTMSVALMMMINNDDNKKDEVVVFCSLSRVGILGHSLWAESKLRLGALHAKRLSLPFVRTKGKTETGIAAVELKRNKKVINKFVLSNLINVGKKIGERDAKHMLKNSYDEIGLEVAGNKK
jgi:hypothetical protein